MTPARIVLLALVAATLAAAACGKKGNPIRPTSDAQPEQTEEN